MLAADEVTVPPPAGITQLTSPAAFVVRACPLTVPSIAGNVKGVPVTSPRVRLPVVLRDITTLLEVAVSVNWRLPEARGFVIPIDQRLVTLSASTTDAWSAVLPAVRVSEALFVAPNDATLASMSISAFTMVAVALLMMSVVVVNNEK